MATAEGKSIYGGLGALSTEIQRQNPRIGATKEKVTQSDEVICIVGLWFNEWMNEWMNEKYIARLKAYECILNLPRLAEN